MNEGRCLNKKNPGRDGRPGLTYGFSSIRERCSELAISAETAENRDIFWKWEDVIVF